MDPSRPQFNPFFNFSQPSSYNTNDDAQDITPPTPIYPGPNFPMMNPNNFQMPMYQNSNSIYYPHNFQMPFYPNPTTTPHFPEFSTQPNLVPEQASGSKNEKNRWTTKDDILLCSAWLNIGKDATIGTDQNKANFWNRVLEYYDVNRNTSSQKSRNRQGLQNRWARLNHAVSKFVGCYEQILHRRESGLNEEDKKNRALELYRSLEGGQFNFLHAWVELRDQEKWTSQQERPIEVDLVEDRGSKRTKNDGSGQYTSSSSNTNTSTPELTSTARPMGRKASKDKGKHECLSTNSIDRIDKAMKEQFNLDAEKIEAMKSYTEAIKERERKKDEREKKRGKGENERAT